MSKKQDISRVKTLAAFAAETQTSSTDPNWKAKLAEWQHNKMVERLRAQGEPDFGLEPVRSETDQPVLEVAEGLNRVRYVPTCVACGATEDLYQSVCKLCFADYLTEYRNEIEEKICQLIEYCLRLTPGTGALILDAARRGKTGKLEVDRVVVKHDPTPGFPDAPKGG